MGGTAFENISILVICMAVGFAARKGRIISAKDMPGLTALTLNVTLPALLIMAMQRKFDAYAFRGSLAAMALTVAIHALCLVLAILIVKVLRVKGAERAVLLLALLFPNTGFMGIPLVNAMFGHEAMLYTALINSVMNTLVPTVGIAILLGAGSRGQINLKSILLNKIILATLIGFILFIFSIRIPELLGNGLTMVGSATTPLSMIIIGGMLAENDLKSVFSEWKIYIVALFRLLAFPLLVFFTLRRAIEDQLAVNVLTMLTAMPVAAITAILAAEHDKEPQLASKIVFVTTALSIFTIPIIAMIIV